MTNSETKFKEFVTTCSGMLKGESAEFLALIRKRYENCKESFRKSPEMVKLLETTSRKMLCDQKRLFVHLKDFLEELRAWTTLKPEHQSSRKRKAEDRLSSVAKISRLEDSLSDGSDIEGKLKIALGITSAALSPSYSLPLATSCCDLPSSAWLSESSIEKSQCRSKVNLPELSETSNITGVTVNGCNHNLCRGNKCNHTVSCTVVGSGKSVQNTKTSFQKTCANADYCEIISETSEETVKMPLKENVIDSLGLSDKNHDAVIPETSIDHLNFHWKLKESRMKINKSKLGNAACHTECAQRKDKRDIVVNSTGCSSRIGQHIKSSDGKSDLLIHNDDKLKNHFLQSPTSSLPSFPLLTSAWHDGVQTNKEKNTNDVIMIDNDEKLPLLINGKQVHEASEPSGNISVTHHTASYQPCPSGMAEARVKDSFNFTSEKIGGLSKQERRIKRLEKLLEQIRDKIEEVQEKTLSVDDMDDEDSAYIFEDRLQKKFVKVWRRLCQLKGRDTSSGRPVERKFRYQGTRFPEINRKIEKFINCPDSFPDYHDIINIIRKVNARNKLGLSVNQINDISRETFLDVGESLQKRRHEDFISTFRSRQIMTFSCDQDPALFDAELKRKLDENQRIGKSRLEEVISKYSKLQTELGDEEKEEVERSDAENVFLSGEKVSFREEVMVGSEVANLEYNHAAPLNTTHIAGTNENSDAGSEDETDNAYIIEILWPYRLEDKTPKHGLQTCPPLKNIQGKMQPTSTPVHGKLYGINSDDIAVESNELEGDEEDQSTTSINECSALQRNNCDFYPVNKPNQSDLNESSFPHLQAVSLLDKKAKAVKISTSLNLPKFLFHRNGNHSDSKPETLFYPHKMQSYNSTDEIDDVVTVIPSDEELELNVSRDVKQVIKNEPLGFGENFNDVIVLSDSD